MQTDIASQCAALAASRLEAWYVCPNVQCRHGFFRNLSPTMACPSGTCATEVAPFSEHVDPDPKKCCVAADYCCPACNRQWKCSTSLNKLCQRCKTPAQPADPSLARGTGHARCSRCQRISYELNVTVGAPVECRHCRNACAAQPAVVLCSAERRRILTALTQSGGVDVPVLELLLQACYHPRTRRTRHAPASLTALPTSPARS